MSTRNAEQDLAWAASVIRASSKERCCTSPISGASGWTEARAAERIARPIELPPTPVKVSPAIMTAPSRRGKATTAKAPRERKRPYPWYEGLPLCRSCWVQHEGACPIFDMHAGPCPCSFGRGTVPAADSESALKCPPGPHARYQVARSMGALAELLREAQRPKCLGTTVTGGPCRRSYNAEGIAQVRGESQ